MNGVQGNVSALLEAALGDCGILWVDTGARTYAVWYACSGRDAGPGSGATAYVVNGPGEQHLPWLPPEVELVLRDRTTRGRGLRVRATRQVLDDADPQWALAVAALRERRLNAPDPTGEDTVRRWRETCTVTALRPYGEPLETAVDPPTGLATTQVASWTGAGG